MNTTTAESDEQVTAIVRRLFELRPEQVTDELRRGGVERWDSLGHLELLSAVQKELRVEIPLDDILSMETVADVKSTVARYISKS